VLLLSIKLRLMLVHHRHHCLLHLCSKPFKQHQNQVQQQTYAVAELTDSDNQTKQENIKKTACEIYDT
jgi:hypothetical protein